MDKRTKLKWVGIFLLLLTAAVTAVTIFLAANLTKSTAGAAVENFDETLSGTLKNAYIEQCRADSMIVCYKGKRYLAQGAPEEAYTGVADLIFSGGKVVKINAKPEGISGILASYSEQTVQIAGYEPLACAEELPVYTVSDGEVTYGTLSDLLIGNSKVKLVVADGTACAVVCTKSESPTTVRVLIKNGSELLYSDLYVCGSGALSVDKTAQESGTVVRAKTSLKKAKTGTEVRIRAGDGELLYVCDKDGNPKGEGYEGELIFRKAEGGYVLISELSIEDYVRYVLPSEMPASFSYEALKAQAVCARTFAYRQLHDDAYAQYGANLDDSTSYQVYHSAAPTETTDKAVAETAGLVLTYQGSLIDCYYYSTSPGYTENLEVWNADSPAYLVAENLTQGKTTDLSSAKKFHKFITKSVASYDDASPYYRWTATLSAKLGMDSEYGRLQKITVNERSSSGYVLSMTIQFEQGERTVTGENDIRFSLGKYVKELTLSDSSTRNGLSSVPSACFEVTSQTDGTIVLTGGGFGHGIGMSQYGADAMGREGKSFSEILACYYKDTVLMDVSALDIG